MPTRSASRPAKLKNRLASFTLIELLTVMAIIAILAALILAAGNGVMTKGMRNRASAEIQAMSAALEGYKTDNGIYPPTSSSSTLLTNLATDVYFSKEVDGTQSGASGYYQINSEVLYQALSGQTNYADTPLSAGKSYMSFKPGQLGNTTTAGATSPNATYIKDPWGYSYSYSTGTAASYPFNGTGFFDLWSTGGVTITKMGTTPSLTNAWLSNWQ
jgi:prepilin-type N-terminal cleavage/methylation domain-containing protein